jgi:lipopolysaccharide export system permease protein
MSVIRNLVLKEWIRFFIGAFIVLILLITVAELISGFLRTTVTPTEVIFNHLLELPGKFKLIMPVSCLAASLFSINKLKNRNELTAIFASGYSRKRFMRDIAVGGVIVALSQFLISSFIEPYAKSKKDLFIKDGQAKFKNLKSKGLMASTIGSGKMWFKSDRYFFSFSTFDKEKSQLNDITTYFFNSSNLILSKVTAPYVRYVAGAWMTDKAIVVNDLTGNQFPSSSEKLSFNLKIDETPSDFKEIEADITTLNFFKLFRYILKLNEGGINVNEYLVILLEKISISIVCIVFSLVAAIGAFTPNRRGSSFGKSLIGVFVFVILYWLINSYFIQLGISSKIHPVIACFSVPVLFAIYLTHYFFRNRTLK